MDKTSQMPSDPEELQKMVQDIRIYGKFYGVCTVFANFSQRIMVSIWGLHPLVSSSIHASVCLAGIETVV